MSTPKADHPNNNPLHALSMAAWDWALNQCSQDKVLRVAIDAGANEGGYTHMLRQHGFKVHAFEPIPRVFATLHDRFKEDPMVYCNQMGLSDYPGVLKNIQVRGAWTILPEDWKGNTQVLGKNPTYGDDRFDVVLTTIDEYCDGSPIGFIKLDVEGYEHKVLAGAVKTIQAYHPPILCEFGCFIDAVSGSSQAFVECLLWLGYHVVAMDGSRIFRSWPEIKPHYPFGTTFDVMLIPAGLSEKCQKDLA